jgi:hypothetical protein
MNTREKIRRKNHTVEEAAADSGFAYVEHGGRRGERQVEGVDVAHGSVLSSQVTAVLGTESVL